MASGSGKSLAKIVLTHRSLEALKPAPDAYRVPDLRCPGLAIRVAPSGLKTWDFVCRVRGTSTVKRKALGAFPGVSLDDARRRGGAIGDAAQGGRNLIEEESKAREATAARMTVSELIDEYIKRRAKGLRTKREIETRLKRALAPINSRTIDELRRRDISRLLNATSDRGVEREAEKQRQSVGAMFRWAVGQDLLDDDPTRGLKPFSAGKPRERVLAPDEIKTLWNWIASSDLTLDMQDSLRLQFCWGSRIGEASGLCVEEIDTKDWIWTLPASRSKNKRSRRTPIVGLAREIIEDRLGLERVRKGPLFINETGAALRSNDIGSAIVTRRKRIPLAHFVSHDIRRSVATELVNLGIALELVAAVLGHEVGDKSVRILTRHYVRTDLLDRKKVALEAWDDRLRSIIEGNNRRDTVVRLADIRTTTT